MTIDARGIGCPKPVIMAEEALNKISEGFVNILVDNEASVGNLTRFAKKKGFYVDSVKENKHWKVKIAKGYACEPTTEELPAAAEEALSKDMLLVIGTDTMGRDEELGKILMKAFFETMKVTKQLPHTIFFLNTGVRLTTLNEEFLPVLKDLEAMGVEIFSCGTCLKHYNLESELKVGFRGTTNHIVEGLVDFKKTVWIG